MAGSHVTRGRKSPWHHLGLILYTVDKPEVTDQFIIIDVFRRGRVGRSDEPNSLVEPGEKLGTRPAF